MQPLKFEEVLENILVKDSRYHRDAFVFMREALEHTQHAVAGKHKQENVRHVSGTELLEGIRSHALNQFGPMVMTVLGEWGIQSCQDFGEIVFLMVEYNLLAKTDKDTREDFKAGYNFSDAFRKPYLPTAKMAASVKTSVQA